MSGEAKMDAAGIGVAWEELEPGQRIRTVGRTLREADIVMFTGMTGILPAAAVDAAFNASQDGEAGLGVPPILAYCLAEGLLAGWDRASGLGFDALDLTVEGPCRLGDTIRLELEVVSVSGPLAGGRGRVSAYHVVRNQRGEVVLAYRQTRLLRGRAERDRLAAI